MNVYVGRAPLRVLLLLVVLPALARAQAPDQTAAERGPYVRHPEAVKAMSQLKSPYCPGMLEVCSSGAGHALRDSIAQLADDGWPADSIVSWVLARHGADLLALPPRRGKALVAWVVPPLAVVAGFGMVILALQRMLGRRPPRVERDDLTPEEEEKLREAMRELEAEEEVPFL